VTRRFTALAFAFAAAAAAIGVACGIDAVGTYAGAPIPDRDTGTDAPFVSVPTADAMPDVVADADAAPPPPCPTNLPGPALVPVFAADAGDAGRPLFCVDSTEITNTQYQAFLTATDAAVSTSFLDASVYEGGLPAFCFPRMSAAPYPSSPGGPDEPVSHIDWCDAYAYCQWAGKHLCTTAADGGSNEWRRACTRDGTRTLPYGDAPEAGACNVGNAAGGQQPVKTRPKCEGGYSGIFDMVGNSEEWVAECAGGYCETYGGWWGSAASASCMTSELVPPRTATYGVTVRCCR
jgi:formylglycine-generating enzyme